MALCALAITSCNVGLHYSYDREMEHSIKLEQEAKRSNLLKEGASEQEISKALIKVEERYELLEGWERSTYKTYAKITLANICLGVVVGWGIYLFFVRRKYRKSIVSIVLVVGLSGGAWPTYLIATDTKFLMVASVMDREYFGYLTTGFVGSPDVALYILTEVPWLHSRCGRWSKITDACHHPLLHHAAGIFDQDESKEQQRAIRIAKWLIDNGESVNGRYRGMPLVHRAILYEEPRLLKLLIESGADLTMRNERSGHSSDGMTPLEFAKSLKIIDDHKRSRILELLEQG